MDSQVVLLLDSLLLPMVQVNYLLLPQTLMVGLIQISLLVSNTSTTLHSLSLLPRAVLHLKPLMKTQSLLKSKTHLDSLIEMIYGSTILSTALGYLPQALARL
jgi:hypothetical protein